MKDICVASIISYNPDIHRLLDNITAICNQVSHVIVVDNGSDNYDEIESKLLRFDNVILHSSPTNKGIAWALNQCFELASSHNAKWVLTLDQDSVCPTDMIAKYNTYLTKIGKHTSSDKIDRIGILCPTIVDRNVGTIEGGTSHSQRIRKCITSGALTSFNAWEAVGGFDEKMFIDGVDFEFCDRLNKNDFYIVRVANLELLHELGQMTTRRFLFFKVNVKNHSALRKYYITRNRLYVARKHRHPFSIAKAYLSITKALFIVLLFESDKIAKCKAILKGICDYKKM